jgi:hypothetical protein
MAIDPNSKYLKDSFSKKLEGAELEAAMASLKEAAKGFDPAHPTVDRRAEPRREPEKISPVVPGDRDYEFQVNIIEAGMAATLSLTPSVGKGKNPELAGLVSAIKTKNVKFGLLEEEIKDLIARVISTKEPVKERVIAWGRPADPGIYSQLILAPSFMDHDAFVKFYPEEGIDFLEGFEKYEKWAKVKSGDELARFTPAHKGLAGSTVTGAVIPIQVGVDVHQVGANVLVEKNEDGTQQIWKAEGDGIAVFFRNTIAVLLFGEVSVRFSLEDGDFSAVMQLIAPVGVWKLPNFSLVQEAIKKEGLTFGLDTAKIESQFELFIKERKSKVFICATGKKPIEGPLQEIIFHVDRTIKDLLEEDEFGRIDYRIRQNAIVVTKGQHLCTVKTFNKEERKGTTVKGATVYPGGGKNLYLKAKKGVSEKKINEEITDYFAEIDGELVYDEKRCEITVSTLKVVPSIDLAFGHLKFIGDVEVQKDIEDGMKVVIDGDLYVKGMILGAQVEVTGNVSCEGGINTKKDGFVKCQKNLRAKFIDQSRIYCASDIKVEKGILSSRIACLGNFEATSDKSVMQGGSLQVKGNVLLQNLGSETGTQALVHLGADYLKSDRYHEIVKTIRLAQEEILKMDQQIQDFKNKSSADDATAENKSSDSEMSKLVAEKQHKLTETLKIRDEGKKIFEELQVATDVVLTVRGKAFSHNTVRFGGHDFLLREMVSNVKFSQNPETHEIIMTQVADAKAKKK